MDMTHIDSAVSGRAGKPETLIEVLQDIQDIYNYLPEESLWKVSETLEVPIIEVFRVASFYKAFRLEPQGKHLVTICTGTACHVRGAPKFSDEIRGQLDIAPGETTKDKLFTVETVNCVGACALGPIVILDENYNDHMTSLKLRKLITSTKEADKENTINEENNAS
jgi:NADH:ubiquinone oxidoreductase subunit E